MENLKSLTNMEENLLSRLKPEYAMAMKNYVNSCTKREYAETATLMVASIVDILKRKKYWLDLKFVELETMSRVFGHLSSDGVKVTIIHPAELFISGMEEDAIEKVKSVTLTSTPEHFGYKEKDAK